MSIKLSPESSFLPIVLLAHLHHPPPTDRPPSWSSRIPDNHPIGAARGGQPPLFARTRTLKGTEADLELIASAPAPHEAILLHRDTSRLDEPHDLHDHTAPNPPNISNLPPPSTTPLHQRQQRQADALWAQQRGYSHPSSSSGSAPRTLPPTSNPDLDGGRQPQQPQQHQTRQRSASLDSARRNVRFADLEDTDGSGTRPRAQSQTRDRDTRRPPHPALRISRRTHSAIIFALEEALRTPRAFTIVPEEEYASMAELTAPSGGRAQNGGGSRAGPSSSQSQPPTTSSPQVRKPTDIMRERNRKKAEAEAQATAQESSRVQEDRRQSAERRAAAAAAAAGVGGSSRDPPMQRPGPGAGPVPESSAGYAQYPTSGGPPPRPGPPPAAASAMPGTAGAQASPSAGPSSRRPRGGSQSQDLPPQPSSSRPYESQQPPQPPRNPAAGPSSQQAGKAPAGATSTSAGASSSAPPKNNVSSFPHAFERWETLSSHWEGLTGYWIRRLELNKDEIQREPLNAQMARQITDLSAAGANLFHAVVELQRLRASSERKFQRWFFETRAEQERTAELYAQMTQSLNDERAARERADERARQAVAAKGIAERLVNEKERELVISRDEARRSWEELGRKEAEERRLQQQLREGEPIFIGGIQVLPHQPGMLSRHTTMTDRPGTREGTGYASSQGSAAPGQHIAPYQPGGYYEGTTTSPTNTDPYTEPSHRGGHTVHHEPDVPSFHNTSQPYIPGSTPATSGSTQRTAVPVSGSQQHPASSSSAGPRAQPPPTTSSGFYNHPSSYVSSASPPTGAIAGPPVSHTMSVPVSHATTQPEYDAESYVPSVEGTSELGSDLEDRWARDEHGRILLDNHGQPIPYRYRDELRSPSDDSDIEADLLRERQHLAHYGGGSGSGNSSASAVTYPPVPASTSSVGYPPSSISYPPSAPSAGASHGYGPVDYEGASYGGGGWDNMPRHQHPTRLSDVPEEDERSTTQASQTGRY